MNKQVRSGLSATSSNWAAEANLELEGELVPDSNGVNQNAQDANGGRCTHVMMEINTDASLYSNGAQNMATSFAELCKIRT